MAALIENPLPNEQIISPAKKRSSIKSLRFLVHERVLELVTLIH